MTDQAPSLRPLSPAYVEDQHRVYVEILNVELTKTGADAPRNIALTGHYGSGKSSVLLETQRELAESDVKVINLSLPSLGVGDGRIPEDGNRALDKTNLIQKEIVKQLLYRRKPSDMPASRYSRLDTFDVRRALWACIGLGVAVTGIALLAKAPNRVRDALPPRAWAWLNDHLWGDIAGLIQWLSLLIVFVLTVLAVLWVARLLQQRIRVTELAAGPTKVTLSDASSSYFDEYLDEIVYFFQTSKTSVVIFEDLDRFKDPHIFETLRELNLLLNNAEQTGKTPIRFVYAIRDSVFEQLDVDTDDTSADDEPDGSPADDEVRRLMSTNRTKFFDLVVPMVPFISHRTSRDLIRQELEAIDGSQRPNNAVIDIVGAHLTDMRLIKNICNEYEVFRRRILTDDGLKELTPDRLFASIVYKNLYLAEYEKIRDGTSSLDALYHAYREWVSHQTTAARRAERLARTRLRRIDSIESRADQLGVRLRDVLLARVVSNVHASNVRVVAGGTTFSWADIATDGFWRSYLQDLGDLGVYYRPGYGGESLPFAKVQTLMGQTLSPEDWADEDRAEANSTLAAAVVDLRTVTHASMTDALEEPDKLFPYQGEERSLAAVAEKLFGGSDLVLELLRAGFIDENFTLYITQFPGQAISASAMNFIIKAVQPDVMDIEYHFGATDEVDTDDIKAVLDAEAGRLLGGQSIYNIELFDYLLTEDPEKLTEPIRRLAAVAASDHTFIDAYLASGKVADALVRRLSASWSGIFEYLMGQDSEAPSESLLDAALSGVRSELTYTLSGEQRSALASSIPRLSIVKTEQSEGRAAELAKTLKQIGVRIEDLSEVAEPLRGEMATRRLYPITLGNLRAILGSDEFLPLDTIKQAREADIFPHVLAHLSDYLSALEQATNVPTVANSEQFAEVLADVGKADVDALEDVARRASTDCILSDLDEVEAPLWPAIAGAHRLALTGRNVAAYIAEHGVDSDLANWLTAAGAITTAADDATPLGPLALQLLNAVALGDDATLQLVDGLGLDPGAIVAANLRKDAHTMLPALVEKGLVLDDTDAFTSLEDDEWAIKEKLIAVSKSFPTYMTELSLSTEDVSKIVSRPVPDAVKDVMLTELETFASSLSPADVKTLAEWALGKGRTPTAEALVTLATRGGHRSTEPIIRLLGDQAATIDLDLLKQALDAFGKPFNQLTSPGWDRPKVPVSDSVALILTRLQSEGIVSKFEKNTKKAVFEVSKRHS